MEKAINGYKIFAYNKKAKMITMVSRNAKYLPVIKSQIWYLW